MPGRTDGISKRSVSIAGHRTSVSLEAPFWDALTRLAARRGQPVSAIVAAVDADRGGHNLSSALRVHVLEAATSGELSSPVDATISG